jgi:hypothetical protein
VRARDVAVVAGAVALLAGAFEWPRGLDNTSAVLAPVIALLHTLSLHSLKPLTAGSRDVTALMVIAVGLVAYLVLRRAPWLRPEWLLGGGAVLQLALTVLPLVAITGHLGYGVNRTGGDFATLAWIDRHTSGPVTWLPSEPRIGDFGYMQRNALFWNDEIRTRTIITESTPQPDSERLNALPTKVVGVDDATGAMSAPPPSPFVIAATNSPYQQPAGAVVAHSPAGDLQLVRMPEPRLVFRSKGLGPADEVTPASRVRLLFWPGQAAGFDVGVTLHGGKLPAVVQAGGQRVDVPAGATAPLRFGVCGARPVVPVVVTGVATPADALVSLDEVALRPRTSCT